MSELNKISEALSQTSKGNLTYDRDWKLEELLADLTCNERYTSLHPAVVGDVNLNHESLTPETAPNTNGFQGSPRQFSRLSRKSEEVCEPPDNVTEETGDQYLMQFVATEKLLKEYDDQRLTDLQNAYEERKKLFTKCSDRLYSGSVEHLECARRKQKIEQDNKAKELEAKEEVWQKESSKKHQKLKDEHASLSKISDDRLQEAVLKDKQEQEEINKRILEFKSRIAVFASCQQDINAKYQLISKLIQSCKDVNSFSENVRGAIRSTSDVLNAIQKIVEQIKNGKLDQTDLDVVQSYQNTMTTCLETIKNAVEDISKTAEEQAKSRPINNEISTPVAVKVPKDSGIIQKNDGAFKQYFSYMSLLDRTRKSYEELVANPTVKKYRFDLQKAVNTMVNVISDQSGSHLRDKMQRLSGILAGQQVNVSNMRISINDHPKGKDFCLDLFAKKFVQQGEEQVSASHKAAFPIAAVILGLWKDEPAFGELLLAHFYLRCSYLVPYHIPRKETQSEDDYHISLGYNIVDGQLEQKDKFLKRMSGIVRLYAAILITPLPPGYSNPHPHGVEHGWIWFSRMLNLEPLPDITATVLFDFLDMCGHALQQTYGRQFQKQILLMCQDYFPKIRNATAKGSGGPVARLEGLLQKCLIQRQFPSPEGRLAPKFWHT